MKTLRFLAVVTAITTNGMAFAQDGPLFPGGSLASGANLRQSVGDLALSALAGGSPLSNGLGQFVSGWSNQGIQGTELADRIHWLQAMRADQIAERTRGMDPGRLSRDRDFREDRREIRDDQRRLARDREDLRRDLRDRDDRGRDRDIREDRRELREDERRLARDREDLRRDRDRDDRFRDRDREDRGRDRDDRFRDRDRDERSRDRDRDDRLRDRDRDNHGRDRDDHFRDRDPRQDRDQRRGDHGELTRRDREGQSRVERDHHEGQSRAERDHHAGGAEKNDIGKHVGALGGKQDVHPVHADAHKADVKSHAPDPKSAPPSGGRLQRLKDAVPSFGSKGKGKG